MMQAFEWHLNADAAASSKFVTDNKLDLTENWGLTVAPRAYGEAGLIRAVARPAAKLSTYQPGDGPFAAI
jgi:hypothetical protein